MSEAPKVFISYSHDSDEHKQWVIDLGTRLRGHGVNVVLDHWDTRLGSDLSFFMEQGLTKSKLVICICSEKYIEKANAVKGGVGYEKSILTQSLMQNASLDYIIPLIRNCKASKEKLPTFLSAKLYIDFENDGDYYNKYSELLERIYDEDQKKKPSLGKNPFLPDIANTIDKKIKVDKAKYLSPAMEGSVTFNYSNNDGNYIIGTGDYLFVTKWSECGENSIHAYRDRVKEIGFIKGFTRFPEPAELVQFDYSSRARSPVNDEVVVWLNMNGKLAATKIVSVNREEHILSFEYKIYTGITLQNS